MSEGKSNVLIISLKPTILNKHDREVVSCSRSEFGLGACIQVSTRIIKSGFAPPLDPPTVNYRWKRLGEMLAFDTAYIPLLHFKPEADFGGSGAKP